MSRFSSVKQSCVFSRAYRQGESFAAKHIVVYKLKRRKKGEYTASSLGLTVSKKYGKAVERTRARRILREAYRRLFCDIPCGYDIIVVARHSLIDAKMQDALYDMRLSFEKLGLLRPEATE